MSTKQQNGKIEVVMRHTRDTTNQHRYDTDAPMARLRNVYVRKDSAWPNPPQEIRVTVEARMRLTGESFDKRASRFGGGDVEPVVAHLRAYRRPGAHAPRQPLLRPRWRAPDADLLRWRTARRAPRPHRALLQPPWAVADECRERIPGAFAHRRARFGRLSSLALDDEAWKRRSVLTLAEVAQESGAHVAAGLAMRYPGVGV